MRPLAGDRVVIFTISGVTWGDIGGRAPGEELPTFDKLIREGSTAALAPRTASVRPSAERGYLTLGAGNRAAASNESSDAQLAYGVKEEVYEGITAGEINRTLGGCCRSAAVVHLGVPELQSRQDAQYHGAKVGALGEALQRGGIDRGIISAADLTTAARPPDTGRGGPVLAMVDNNGVVPQGLVRGLVSPGGPLSPGITNEDALVSATRRMLGAVDLLMVEPGETLRADNLANHVYPDAAKRIRREALSRTDRLLNGVVRALEEEDLLLVVGVSSSSTDRQEHLTPIIAWGAGTKPGELRSATTHRAGSVTLTDVAPTVLSVFGLAQPASMSGRPIRRIASDAERPQSHDELDRRSVFRERFVPAVFYSFVALFVLLFVLVAFVFLLRLPFKPPLVSICYLILALPLATFMLTAVPLWNLGVLPAQILLWTIAIALAAAAWLVPGPRWTGAVPLVSSLAVFVGVVLLFGGHLLANAVFGNSVLAAGRFYGIPNTGSALFFGACVLSVMALGELRHDQGLKTWMAAALFGALVLTGWPTFGADVGGLLTGVAAVGVILLVARGARVPWKVVALVVFAAVAVTMVVAYVDSLRSIDQQTHLGRFVDGLFSGDGTATTTIRRKATQALASLSFSRFTYVVPLAVAALGVLLRGPGGPLRAVLSRHRLFRAGMAGILVAGIMGFALNDSGVAVPALLLAQAVPLVVLLGVDHVRSQSTPPLDG